MSRTRPPRFDVIDPPLGVLVSLPPRVEPPQPRSDSVPRVRLLHRLDRVLEAGVGLITAGPGYGKTSLLASWSTQKHSLVDVAWLALEPDHDDPLVLADHLRLATQPFLPIGQGGLDRVLAVIARAAIGRERPLLLILDDAHQVSSENVFATLGGLLEQRPPGLYVVIASRTSVPGPWTRLRAKRELVELRVDDLAFDDEEARALMSTFGADLDEGSLSTVQHLTEGWVAGLCLAGHAFLSDSRAALQRDLPATLDEAWRYLEHP